MLIGIIGWAVLGLIIGFIFSNVINLHGDDPRFGIAFGVVAAVVGGWIFSWISGTPVAGFHIWSLTTAAVAACAGVIGWHIVRSRGAHDRPTVRRSY